MLMCRQVAKALAEDRYYELPLFRRLGLRLHVFLCFMCGPYHRQVMDLQDGVKHYLDHELEDPPPQGLALSPDARERIAHSLHEA